MTTTQSELAELIEAQEADTDTSPSNEPRLVWNDLDGYTCSCGNNGPDLLDHEDGCDLMWSDDFSTGFAEWDAEKKVLVAVVHPDWDYDEATGELTKIISDETDEYDDWDNYWDSLSKKNDSGKKPGVGWSGSWNSGYGFGKCRHYQQAVTLPNGTVIYASSSHTDRQKDPIPDLGIYMDGCWKPDTIAFHVGCPDYGVPIPAPWQVIHIAREGLRVAGEGKRVEVGCIGGHGRTGMMLAIMIVVASEGETTGKEAVAYVQANYCKEAVESSKQEWYVDGIHHEMQGKPWPAMPVPPPPLPRSETCRMCNHYMLHGPNQPCVAKVAGEECGCNVSNAAVDTVHCKGCSHYIYHSPSRPCSAWMQASRTTCGCTLSNAKESSKSPETATQTEAKEEPQPVRQLPGQTTRFCLTQCPDCRHFSEHGPDSPCRLTVQILPTEQRCGCRTVHNDKEVAGSK